MLTFVDCLAFEKDCTETAGFYICGVVQLPRASHKAGNPALSVHLRVSSMIVALPSLFNILTKISPQWYDELWRNH